MPATYEPIATTTLGSAQSTITFSSIPGTYTDLVAVSTVAFNNTDSLALRFNGDTSSSTLYSWTMVSGNGSGAVSTRATNGARALADYNGFPTSTVGEYVSIVQIMNYSNSTTFKTAISRETQQPADTAQMLLCLCIVQHPQLLLLHLV